jgi:hypothetical protein
VTATSTIPATATIFFCVGVMSPQDFFCAMTATYREGTGLLTHHRCR